MERKRTSRRILVREKTFMHRCKDYLRQFIAFMFSNVGIIGLVVGYTIAGAFFFRYIEGGEATKGNILVMQLRDETAQRLWNFTFTLNIFEEFETKWTNSVTSELVEYQRVVVAAIIDEGFDGSDSVVMEHQWTFAGAFLYSLTVITTIGYGNVTPRTNMGKIATIFYAIAGMPLFLLYLSNIGDILARSFKWLYARCCLCKCCPKKRKPPPPVSAPSSLPTLVARTLQRGDSDRGPAPRPTAVSRLHGSLSLEDGVNVDHGRRQLDDVTKMFSPIDKEFNERNHRINGVRRASSIGDVTALNKTEERAVERGGSEKMRRVLTRQEELMELNDFGLTSRGGSERLRRQTDKELGMSKAELVLGMNDRGLEYLDLPKKRGPLQRVFGGGGGKPDGRDRGGLPVKEVVNSYIPPAPPPPRIADVEAVTSDEESDDDGSDGSEEEFDSQTVTVPVTLCLAIMVGYICGGASLFAAYEGLGFLDGSYFCFISLSTIGFGDIVPGGVINTSSDGIELSFIFCSMYLMLGMAMIAMCFNLMQEEVMHKIRSCMSGLRNCLGCVKRGVLPAAR